MFTSITTTAMTTAALSSIRHCYMYWQVHGKHFEITEWERHEVRNRTVQYFYVAAGPLKTDTNGTRDSLITISLMHSPNRRQNEMQFLFRDHFNLEWQSPRSIELPIFDCTSVRSNRKQNSASVIIISQFVEVSCGSFLLYTYHNVVRLLSDGVTNSALPMHVVNRIISYNGQFYS